MTKDQEYFFELIQLKLRLLMLQSEVKYHKRLISHFEKIRKISEKYTEGNK